jgi:predicted dehydrogenase
MRCKIQKVLVVGSGSIAKRHIRNLRHCYPNALIACVSSTGRKIEPADVGASMVFADLQVAAKEAPDFAIVASPANLHLQNAKLLVDHHIPVLVEKPLCMASEQFILEEWSEHGHLVRVAYNLRYMPAAQKMKELLDLNHLGRITTVLVDAGQYLPDWRPDQDYRTGVSARRDLGGGALLELSHELDYLTWFFGRFDWAFGVLRNTKWLDIDVEDNVDAILHSEQGLVAHIHLDFLQRQASRSCKVIGENGALVWDLIKNRIDLYLTGCQTETVYTDITYDRNLMYIDQTTAFVKYINGEGQFETSLESAAEVLQLADSIRNSSQCQQPVPIRIGR